MLKLPTQSQRTRGLKYMSQLVYVNNIYLCPVCLNPSTATHHEPWSTNAHHCSGGYCQGPLVASQSASMVSPTVLYVLQHKKTIGGLVSHIRNNTSHYTKLFNKVVDSLMPIPTKDIDAKWYLSQFFMKVVPLIIPPGRSSLCWSYSLIHDSIHEWPSHTHHEFQRHCPLGWHLSSHSLHRLLGSSH